MKASYRNNVWITPYEPQAVLKHKQLQLKLHLESCYKLPGYLDPENLLLQASPELFSCTIPSQSKTSACHEGIHRKRGQHFLKFIISVYFEGKCYVRCLVISKNLTNEKSFCLNSLKERLCCKERLKFKHCE